MKSAAPLFGILIANLIAGDEIRFGFLKIFKGEKKSAGAPQQGARVLPRAVGGILSRIDLRGFNESAEREHPRREEGRRSPAQPPEIPPLVSERREENPKPKG